MSANDRLSAALLDAEKRAIKRDELAARTRFTTASAKAANEIKYAGVEKKPRTATVRVEADIIELVKKWPTSGRVHLISEAIRAALKSS